MQHPYLCAKNNALIKPPIKQGHPSVLMQIYILAILPPIAHGASPFGPLLVRSI